MTLTRYADDIVVGFDKDYDAKRFQAALRKRDGAVLTVIASQKDPADRVWALCGA